MSAIREFTKLPEKRRVNCCQAKRYSHCFEACRYLAYNALLDGLIKAAGKISTGGRIRNPMRSQTIQESFIIAAQLDINNPPTAAHDLWSPRPRKQRLRLGLAQLQCFCSVAWPSSPVGRSPRRCPAEHN